MTGILQNRPDVIMIKVYVKDQSGKIFQTSIKPKNVTALFWTPPSIMDRKILTSTDAELACYVDNIDKGNLCEVPKELKAEKFDYSRKPDPKAPHRIEDSLLGHFYESIKSNQKETSEATGAAYAASKWCQSVKKENWTMVDTTEDQLWASCEGSTNKSVGANGVSLTGLTPLLYKIPLCKTSPDNPL